ncbi:MAG: V-type ATP synthase subunit D [Nanobdellota archaeon]
MASDLKAATRMELLARKKKIKLASKGHKLLKQKRDALISEFFTLVDKVKKKRKEVEKELEESYRSLIMAQAVDGVEEVKRAADSAKEIPDVKETRKTVMGVRVPQYDIELEDYNPSYSMISTSTQLDTAASNFNNALKNLLKLAEMEKSVELLSEEIKKTKRKVNALERVMLPRLREDVTYITMRLEEMERENFSRLKMIKKRLE